MAGASVDVARLGETGSVIGNRSSNKRAGLRRTPANYEWRTNKQPTRKLPQRTFLGEGRRAAKTSARELTFRRNLQILGQKAEKPV
jgi:hypothetical protein